MYDCPSAGGGRPARAGLGETQGRRRELPLSHGEGHREFLDCLDGNSTPRYSLEEDANVLWLIDDIEKGVYGS